MDKQSIDSANGNNDSKVISKLNKELNEHKSFRPSADKSNHSQEWSQQSASANERFAINMQVGQKQKSQHRQTENNIVEELKNPVGDSTGAGSHLKSSQLHNPYQNLDSVISKARSQPNMTMSK